MGNEYIEAARVFHEITKHSYTSVRASPHFLDWDNKPIPYKIYPGAASVALPRDLNLSSTPTLAALSSYMPAEFSAAIDTAALTRILFCADGLTRQKRVGDDDYHFRAAASAGALYPIEIYVAASEVESLETGLYHFSPADLRMAGLRRGDWRDYIAAAAARRPSILHARAVIAMSAIYWRSEWKYRARAYRYCYWDAGTILANMLAAAAAEEISAEVITAFDDPALEALLGIDTEREGMIALVALGRTEQSAAPSPAAEPLTLETIPLSPNEVAYPDLVKIHRESRLVTADEVATVAAGETGFGAANIEHRRDSSRNHHVRRVSGTGRDDFAARIVAGICAGSDHRRRTRDDHGGFERASAGRLSAVDGHLSDRQRGNRIGARRVLLRPRCACVRAAEGGQLSRRGGIPVPRAAARDGLLGAGRLYGGARACAGLRSEIAATATRISRRGFLADAHIWRRIRLGAGRRG